MGVKLQMFRNTLRKKFWKGWQHGQENCFKLQQFFGKETAEYVYQTKEY